MCVYIYRHICVYVYIYIYDLSQAKYFTTSPELMFSSPIQKNEYEARSKQVKQKPFLEIVIISLEPHSKIELTDIWRKHNIIKKEKLKRDRD